MAALVPDRGDDQPELEQEAQEGDEEAQAAKTEGAGLTIRVDPTMPSALAALAIEHFEPLRVLVPPHVHTVFFRWRPDSEAGMICEHEQAYRIMRIEVTPQSFAPGDCPRRMMCHELAHWFNAPVADAAIAAIERIVGEETPGSRVAEKYLTDVLEAANSDLEQAFLRILGER